MDEDFGLNRFDGGAPGCRPGGSSDARGCFLLARDCMVLRAALISFGCIVVSGLV